MLRAHTIPRLVVCIAILAVLLAWFSCSSQDKTPPNVVLIVIDALRPDFLGCYGYDRPTSPNIDALARRGVVFETAIAHAPWTKTSFATLLTSLYPFQHGVVDWESVMPDTVATLPEALAQAGYGTLAVINMLGITGKSKVTKGFDTVSEANKMNRDAFGTTQDAINLIKTTRRPFFALVHYFDTHRPYRPGPEYLDRVRGKDEPDPMLYRSSSQDRGDGEPAAGVVVGEKVLYSGCIRQVDDALGKLLAFLDDAGLRKNSVVIVTADHGEAFWEHGAGAHGGNLYDEAIRVPLVISYPAKYRHPQRVSAQVRHVDLVPTILDLAGVADATQREGTSLRALMEGGAVEPAPPGKVVPQDVALCESTLRKAPDTKCARTSRFKLIIEPSTGLSEFYDLLNDPLEKVRLQQETSADADRLRRTLSQIPGSAVEGWRVALAGVHPAGAQAGGKWQGEGVGAGADSLFLKITARVEGGGRITQVNRVSTPGDFAIAVAPDSASMTIEAVPHELQLMLFGVNPPDAVVSFTAEARGANGPTVVHAGATGEAPAGQLLALEPSEAFGLPSAFEDARRSPKPSVHIWYLHGQPIRPAARDAGGEILSPEAKQRLRSLGYIQ